METWEQIDAIQDVMQITEGEDVEFSPKGRGEIELLLKRFGFSEVFDAARIAFEQYDDRDTAFSKLGGICYNRQKAKEDVYAKQDTKRKHLRQQRAV